MACTWFHSDGRTDIKVTVAFRNFANAPKHIVAAFDIKRLVQEVYSMTGHVRVFARIFKIPVIIHNYGRTSQNAVLTIRGWNSLNTEKKI